MSTGAPLLSAGATALTMRARTPFARAARSLSAACTRAGLIPTPLVFLGSAAAVLAASAAHEAAFTAFPEELLFRGILQGEIEAATGNRAVAVLIAAALFAAAHAALGRGAAGLLTFFPGLLFGAARARTGQVWPAVALHALANRWAG